MTRQYVFAGQGWTLHPASCLDPIAGLASLSDKSIDVTITDPPYEVEAHTLGRRIKHEPGVRSTSAEEPLPFPPIDEEERNLVAEHIARVTRDRAIVFCQAEAVDAWRRSFNRAGMQYRRAIPWIKPDSMPSLHGRWPGQSYETIVLAQFPSALACPVGGTSRHYSVTRDGGAAPHPTTKPLKLMRQLVEDFSLPGDTILDPFAGSGTTGVAALQLGRRFVGWEISEQFAETAARRLRGDEARPNPNQPSILDLVHGVG